jgi:hypothetical protein
MSNVPVKIDKELKEKIEKFISIGNNRFDYPSVKNFVDKAVLKLLLEEKNEKK